MPKRVSVKGKGADIFFGEYGAIPPDPASDQPGEFAPAVSPGQPSTPETIPTQLPPVEASKNTQKKDVLQESIHARKTPDTAISPPLLGPLTSEVLDSISQYIAKPAAITNAFRYTEQELSWLTDAIYELTKRHSIKMTKQDVARLGLNAVLWDYRTRGDSSLLGEFVARKKRQRGEEP